MSLHDVQPPDCFARAQLIAAEVELIRQEMGRQRDRRPPAEVRGAAPREVYFEALALFRKADRLCQEAAGDPVAAIPHAPPIGEIRPGHVLAVLDAALRELREVKARLGISESSDEPARDASRQPSDVYGQIVTVNRQLNLLLERPFGPADVFQVVSLAVAYAARLLASSGAEPYPAQPAFVRRKTPAEVFERLEGCVAKLRGIFQAAGLTMLDAPQARGDAADVVPADVYDIASLALSELAYLHGQRPDANPPYPFEGNAPGRKLPAHVFQLAGVLDAQLGELARRG